MKGPCKERERERGWTKNIKKERKKCNWNQVTDSKMSSFPSTWIMLFSLYSITTSGEFWFQENWNKISQNCLITVITQVSPRAIYQFYSIAEFIHRENSLNSVCKAIQFMSGQKETFSLVQHENFYFKHFILHATVDWLLIHSLTQYMCIHCIL